MSIYLSYHQVGYSGTSSTGKTHHYYKCNGAIKKICNKKTIQKDYIEEIIVQKARELLTDENIEIIVSNAMEVIEKERNNPNMKRLDKALKDNDKEKASLLSKLKKCDNDSVTKIIFEEIANMEKERAKIENELKYEQANCINITRTEMKTFFKGLRKGNTEDPKYRKALINTLIYQIHLYDDDTFTVVYTTQNKKYEGKLLDIKEIERSLAGKIVSPKVRYANLFLLFIRVCSKI